LKMKRGGVLHPSPERAKYLSEGIYPFVSSIPPPPSPERAKV
jgi:hypothetical protein